MKKHIKFAAVLTAITLSACMTGGCSLFAQNNSNEETKENNTASIIESSLSDDEESSSASREEAASSAAESSAEKSIDESSNEEESEYESSGESKEESSMDESSTESSFASMDESEAAQASNEGYEFDDEQFVEDYHTAVTFTDNEKFNEIFKDNALDKAYDEDLKNAATTKEMMNITDTYAAKWKEMVDKAYQALSESLEGSNSEKLIESQNKWTQGLSEIKNSFQEEAQQGGTEGLIAAETAMMNYYKGRAAKLFEQIYTQNGSIDLSDYGL